MPDIGERQRRIAEWQQDVTSLRDQILAWLTEDDPTRILYVERRTIDKGEEGLGWYEVPALRISLGAQTVDITPAARNVGGRVVQRKAPEFHAAGRVDMMNGGVKYYLYLDSSEAGKKWLIGRNSLEPFQELNKDRFETALRDLLS